MRCLIEDDRKQIFILVANLFGHRRTVEATFVAAPALDHENIGNRVLLSELRRGGFETWAEIEAHTIHMYDAYPIVNILNHLTCTSNR